jgi:hypothetical protein
MLDRLYLADPPLCKPAEISAVGRQAETWLRVHYIESSPTRPGTPVSSRFAFSRK